MTGQECRIEEQPALLVSSTLAAAGTSFGHEYNVVDRHKIRRARKQSRSRQTNLNVEKYRKTLF